MLCLMRLSLWLLSLCSIFAIFFALRWSRPLSVDGSITIEKGNTIRSFFSLLDTREEYRLRLYLRQHAADTATLQLGNYVFSGVYSAASLINQINAWPTQSYVTLRVLEWRSMYDIDAYLVAKWLIDTGAYIAYVTDNATIYKISQTYPFVDVFLKTKKSNNMKLSLEWLLYPDTYFVNANQPVVPQLVKLQLQAFDDKVIKVYGDAIENFSDRLSAEWFSFGMKMYNLITLASIIEKEEKSSTNKPIIAGLFLNRIEKGMRIDADITLCYGRALPYETCTPSVIVRSINDSSNIYNTRVQSWLTPTPIGNPSLETIRAVLDFVKTNNLYYLHDAQGQIYFAESIQGHNSNKSTYL